MSFISIFKISAVHILTGVDIFDYVSAYISAIKAMSSPYIMLSTVVGSTLFYPTSIDLA